MAFDPSFGRARLLAVMAAVALLGAGCLHWGHGSGGAETEVGRSAPSKAGPPPWAPAHGHRRKHQVRQQGQSGASEVRIVLDSDRGVHVVVGFPDHYWDAGHYYRVRRGRWEASTRLEGPWLAIEGNDVPLALMRAVTSRDAYPARLAD